MASVKLGTKAIGSIVKVRVNNALRDFIVVHHGRPSDWYPASWISGTVLVQRHLYEQATWRDASPTVYLEYNFANYALDTKIRNIALQGPALDYFSSPFPADKIFAPSVKEIGGFGIPAYDSSLVYHEGTGATFQYFSSDNATRMATTVDGHQGSWWTRTWATVVSESGADTRQRYAGGISTSGSVDAVTFSYNVTATNRYVRPAFALPSSTYVSDSGEVVTNTAPTAPGSIEYGTPRAAKPLDLIITPATDPD